MREGKLPKRQYTQEFKAEAVGLATSMGGYEAARRLAVPVATLGNWSRRGVAATGGSGAALPSEAPARSPVSELEAENGRLRSELAASGLDRSRWLVEHLLQAETTDRAMRSVQYQMTLVRFPLHRDLAGFDFDA
ncbi:Uncharacterised protein [Xylophilus ampelinus]|nr:Uncharacterised protein [Xylophilus ampelinus]